MKLTIEEIAKTVHTINKAYCESIGDNSQVAWEEAPEMIKKSAISGVESHLKSDLTPEQSHEKWLEYKKEEGWIYGEEKDLEKKIHPCMRSYNELPKEQRVKDAIFKAACDTLGKM